MTRTFAPPSTTRLTLSANAARREFGRVHLLGVEPAVLDVLPDAIEAELLGAAEERVDDLVEGEDRGPPARGQGLGDELHRDGRLADARRSEQERRRARLEAAVQHEVQIRDAARQDLRLESLVMLRRDESRVDDDSSSGDLVIMVAVAEIGPAYLRHVEASPGPAVSRQVLLHDDVAADEALGPYLPQRIRAVVEEQGRHLPLLEEVLESEELAAVTERVRGQEPQFGEPVEDDVPRLRAFDLGEDLPGRLAEFDLRGVEDDVRGVAAQVELRPREVADLDGVEGPAVRAAGAFQVAASLRQRDVEAALAALAARHEILEGERRLPRAGVPLEQVEALAEESTSEDVVETRNSRRDVCVPCVPGLIH